jgi:hypothetical protein
LSYLKQPLFEFLNKSEFITDANREILGRVHKSDLNQTLKEGYLATAQEDQEISVGMTRQIS